MHTDTHIFTMMHTCILHLYLYNNKTEGTVGNGCTQDCANNLHFSYLGLLYFTKQKNNQLDHYHSSASSGGSRANKEGMSGASESEAALTKGQRASAWSLLNSASHPDPSNFSLDFSLGKCSKEATNVDRVPHRTPLEAAVLIRFSTSSTTRDRDVAREDGPPALPSIR
jgi:hypothetical protein